MGSFCAFRIDLIRIEALLKRKGARHFLLAVFALFSAARQWFSLVSLVFLMLYNGKRGKANLKYLFYVFYPTHQAILWLIAECLR